MARTIGIDFGYSRKRETFGFSHFETRSAGGKHVVSVGSETQSTTLDHFISSSLKSPKVQDAVLITLDAPITATRIARRPRTGRLIDRRFSRGEFSNGKRGPQPSSISTPKQGWALYSAAMDLLKLIRARGFTLLVMPDDDKLSLENPSIAEVCPKLTQVLLSPRSRVSSRPRQSYYRQIDNWLFPHLFVGDRPDSPTPRRGTQPSFGADVQSMIRILGSGLIFDQSFWNEAKRIQSVSPLTKRHELIGAFVAGFQGAITLAGKGQLTGVEGGEQGSYLLPRHWHGKWQSVWDATKRKDDVVRSATVGFSLQLR